MNDFHTLFSAKRVNAVCNELGARVCSEPRYRRERNSPEAKGRETFTSRLERL